MPTRLAPAKINLTLHVTGQRQDGYHDLDSLVVFAAIGDEVTLYPAGSDRLQVTGPRAAGVPTDASNLVTRAARAMGAANAALRLVKHLPAAAGMGGGSSDAAAALRLLAEDGALPLPTTEALMALGADLPVCMAAPAPARMRGRGEQVTPVAPLPPLGLLIVNPGLPLSTPAVFAALQVRQNPPMPDPLPHWSDARQFCDWLRTMRNDLEAPARLLLPRIGHLLEVIAAAPGCLLARMTGSGATCFGLFDDPVLLAAAARQLEAPGRFVAATQLLTASDQLTRATT